MSIQLKVTKMFNNSLLNRKEVDLFVYHPNKSTPEKSLVCKELSENYSIPKEQIYVFGMSTGYGSNDTVLKAHMYGSMESLKEVARDFVIRRLNGEVKEGPNRRMRKDARKKKAKMFGTLRRKMRKQEKREERE